MASMAVIGQAFIAITGLAQSSRAAPVAVTGQTGFSKAVCETESSSMTSLASTEHTESSGTGTVSQTGPASFSPVGLC